MKFKDTVIRGLKAAADFLLPRLCIVCERRLLLDERIICLHCMADMPMTHFWKQKNNPMADRFNAAIQHGLEKAWEAENLSDRGASGMPSRIPRNPRERYAYAAALFFYSHEADYRQILYNLKYKGRIDVGRHFGRMLGSKLCESSAFRDVDCVMPVPLHWARRWRRGYNQAEVIAKEVAEAFGVQLRCDILTRRRRTKTQTRLDIKGKAENVVGAFGVKEQNIRNATKVKHILLIDDVFTTGSTLMACFTALREVFPPSVRISVATLAFVGIA
jgi:ComF family protein